MVGRGRGGEGGERRREEGEERKELVNSHLIENFLKNFHSYNFAFRQKFITAIKSYLNLRQLEFKFLVFFMNLKF
jgi:hypothetical protein